MTFGRLGLSSHCLLQSGNGERICCFRLSSFFLLLSLVTFCQIERNRRIKKSKNMQQHAGMHYHYDKLLITLTFNLLIFNIFYIIFTAQSDSNFPNVTNTTNFSSIIDLITINKINWCESVGILLHFFLFYKVSKEKIKTKTI